MTKVFGLPWGNIKLHEQFLAFTVRQSWTLKVSPFVHFTLAELTRVSHPDEGHEEGSCSPERPGAKPTSECNIGKPWDKAINQSGSRANQ